MAKSMQHWNGYQLCAIDTETTGLEPGWNEIVQLAIVPLDSQIKPRKDVLPLNMFIKPEHPERAYKEAMKVNKMTLAELAIKGFDSDKARDLLTEWVDKLDLPYTKHGNRKKIIPLGQNYGFDRGFISHWLGLDEYERMFHYHYRDTMIASHYLNDRSAFHAEPVPFPKSNLSYLAKTLSIDHSGAHDALADCLMSAEVYRQMISRGLLG
jgi:DNA polymerase III epsilon subunit-like protein